MSENEDVLIQEQTEYICEKCKKLKKRSTKSIFVSSEEPSYKCKICNKYFNSAFETKKQKKLYTCEKCKKEFKFFSQWKSHSYKHNNQWPFQCPTCGKGFAEPSILGVHMQSHNENLNFQCSECGLKLKYKKSLEVHSLQHSGKHKWNCKICTKGYAHKSDLNRHMVCHKEGKDFECNDCDKTFKYKNCLIRHCRKHHSEKYTYKCETFSEGFSTKSKLENHKPSCCSSKDIPNLYKENTWKCKVCCKEFANELEKESHACFPLAEQVFDNIELPSTSVQKTISDYHHSEEPTQYPFGCDLCGSVCISAFDLKRHKIMLH
ncbi:zinc finger protein 226 [Trichonephila clavipes]|nr:zinc finger protein 226 [Trichonephila clavipes]